jgi:hypothetical protein
LLCPANGAQVGSRLVYALLRAKVLL